MKRLVFSAGKLAILGLMMMTASCKKDTDLVQPTTGDGGFVASFMNVRWQMTEFKLDPAIDLDGDGRPESDLMQFLRPCDLDNGIVFLKNGNMSGDNGKLKCDDDTDPSTEKPSTWTYDNAAKVLTIKDGDDGSLTEWNVIEASAKYLKIKSSFTEEGQKLTTVMIWKAS